MALIPSDIGVRLRTDTDALLQPTPAVPEIPADLPELRPGQGFTARILESLPQNTYKALVAGKTVTLALPEGANPGDVLDLQVVDRTPRTIVAQLSSPTKEEGTVGTATYRYADLSPTARFIGSLLPEGDRKAPPAALVRGTPLVATPPLRGTDLAPVLQRAIAESGLFYEAHQVQWANGQLPLGQLLAEPQGRHSNPATLFAHGLLPAEYEVPAQPVPPAGNRSPPTEQAMAAPTRESPLAVLLQALLGGEKPSPPAQPAAAASLQTFPEDLKPLVQQQLDGAANQRLAWHGEAWPRQAIDWEIEWPRPQASGYEIPDEWTTHLALTTPRLGALDARLSLSGQDLRLTLSTPVGASAADLRDSAPALAAAMEAAGIRLVSLQIHHDTG